MGEFSTFQTRSTRRVAKRRSVRNLTNRQRPLYAAFRSASCFGLSGRLRLPLPGHQEELEKVTEAKTAGSSNSIPQEPQPATEAGRCGCSTASLGLLGHNLDLRFHDHFPYARRSIFKFVPERGHETFGKFASPSFGVAIKAFEFFLYVFKHSLTGGAGKLWRPQNATDCAGFQTGTLMTGLKDAPSRTSRQSERRSLLVQFHKSCFNKSYPDFRNLGALPHLRFGEAECNGVRR